MHSPRAGQINGAPFGSGPAALHPEEQARADLYALIASLLFAPPVAGMLAMLAAASPIAPQRPDHPLGLAWERLVLGASAMDDGAVYDEFCALFVSAGTPQINPYGSFYLSGNLNDLPLAALRTDLAQLGLARAAGVGETEDHLGALCETMRVLIESGNSLGQPLACQKRFFRTHIAPWYGRCLHDIQTAGEANFYRLLAEFAAAFLTVETEAFELDETCLAG